MLRGSTLLLVPPSEIRIQGGTVTCLRPPILPPMSGQPGMFMLSCSFFFLIIFVTWSLSFSILHPDIFPCITLFLPRCNFIPSELDIRWKVLKTLLWPSTKWHEIHSCRAQPHCWRSAVGRLAAALGRWPQHSTNLLICFLGRIFFLIFFFW